MIFIMRLSYIVLFVTFTSSVSFGQRSYNPGLKKELDSILYEDQRYRELVFSDLLKTKTDSIAAVYKIDKKYIVEHLMTTMQKVDSTNLVRVEAIIKQYGYPGKSLVGTPANEAAFYVIQHSDHIDQYIPIIKKAAEQKELSFTLYAMMLDRSLMYNRKEQIYGTQAKGFETIDKATGKKIFKMIIWPVQNPKTVNALRKKAGFDQTIEENAQRLGVEYEVLTLQQVKAMQGK